MTQFRNILVCAHIYLVSQYPDLEDTVIVSVFGHIPHACRGRHDCWCAVRLEKRKAWRDVPEQSLNCAHRARYNRARDKMPWFVETSVPVVDFDVFWI